MESLNNQIIPIPYAHRDLLLDATDPSSELGKDVRGDIAYVASMGASNIFFLPGAFCEALRNLIRGIRNFDGEAALESGVRLVNIPFGLVYAFQRIAIILITLLKGVVKVALSTTAYIIASIYILFEILLEANRLFRLICFEEELNLDPALFLLKTIKNADFSTLAAHRRELEQALSKDYVAKQFDQTRDIQQIRENLTISILYRKLSTVRSHYFIGESEEVLNGKLDSLARKVRPWFVRELRRELTPTIDGCLRYDKECISRGIELLDTIQTQINKTRKVYIVGLIGLSIAVILFSASLIAAPGLMPVLFALGFIGTTLEFARWFAPESYLDQKDHKWNWNPWLPHCLRKLDPPENPKTPMVELDTF